MPEQRIIKTEIIKRTPSGPSGSSWITPEEAEDLCCVPTKMPVCKEAAEDWGGYTADEIGEKLGITLNDQGQDADGNYVEYRLTKPPSGICGDRITRVETRQQNCCDGVQPLEWDYGSSAEVVTPSSSGVVCVSTGSGMYNWQVRGKGFWLDKNFTIRDGATVDPCVRIYTDASACGTCDITVDDGCTQTSGYLRSSVGQWRGHCTALLLTEDCQWLTGWFYNTIEVGCGYPAQELCSPIRVDTVKATAYRNYAGASTGDTVWRHTVWNGTIFDITRGCGTAGLGPLCDDIAAVRAALAGNMYTAAALPSAPKHGPAPRGTSCNSVNNMCRWSCD